MEDREQPDRPRPHHAHLLAAVDPRDARRIPAQELRREVSQRADHRGPDELHLAHQILLAVLDLDRVRVAVLGRPALQDVGDEDVLARQADLDEQLVQQLPGLTDERQPGLVLVGPRSLTDEHQVRVGVAGPEDHGGARGRQLRALHAARRLGKDRLELLASFGG